MSKKQVKEVLKAIDELPRFSQVADKAMVELRERGLDGSGIEELGFHDPKFVKQMLQMTNFASYGFGDNRAGFFELDSFMSGDILRGVMLAFSIQGFVSKEFKGYGLGENELWEHSVNCGVFSWMIATKVGYKDPEQAFVSGMMHDIGKVVLDKFMSEEKENYVDITIQGGLTTTEVENELVGIGHAEVGAKLAEKWNFDEEVVEAIRYHHQPELADKDPDLAAMIHIADCMCSSINLAFNDNDLLGLLAGDLTSPERQSG